MSNISHSHICRCTVIYGIEHLWPRAHLPHNIWKDIIYLNMYMTYIYIHIRILGESMNHHRKEKSIT